MIVQLYLLRILAIILIVNSHLRGIWPLPQLAFGGHLGNSIFYFLSGFGLTLSQLRQPLEAGAWYKKRFAKILISLLVIITLLSIGDLQRFLNYLWYELIWHKKAQLEAFLPVLWLLYLAFPWLTRCSRQWKIRIVAAGMLLAFLLFQYRMKHMGVIPGNLPSKDIFFSLNALLCFLLGMIICESRELQKRIAGLDLKKKVVVALLLVVFSQGAHQVIHSRALDMIYLNFYLSFVSVLALYVLFMAIDLDLTPLHGTIRVIANSSLAVYLVHPHVISWVSTSDLFFPYTLAVVYVYTFLLGYALHAVSDFCLGSGKILQYYRTKSYHAAR